MDLRPPTWRVLAVSCLVTYGCGTGQILPTETTSQKRTLNQHQNATPTDDAVPDLSDPYTRENVRLAKKPSDQVLDNMVITFDQSEDGLALTADGWTVDME